MQKISFTFIVHKVALVYIQTRLKSKLKTFNIQIALTLFNLFNSQVLKNINIIQI